MNYLKIAAAITLMLSPLAFGLWSSTASASDTEVIDAAVADLQDADLTEVSHNPAPPTPAALTEAKVLQVVDALRDVQAHNGYVGIAFELHVSTAQVLAVKAGVQARRAELHPVEVGELPK